MRVAILYSLASFQLLAMDTGKEEIVKQQHESIIQNWGQVVR